MSFPIYSDHAVQILESLVSSRNADILDNTKTPNSSSEKLSTRSIGIFGRSNCSDTLDEGEGDGDGEGDGEGDAILNSNAHIIHDINSQISRVTGKPNMINKKKLKNRKTKEQLMKQFGIPPSASIVIQMQRTSNTATTLRVPMALVPPIEEVEHSYIVSNEAKHPSSKLYELSKKLNSPLSLKDEHSKNLILVLTLQSGRFAAGIFHKGNCIKHTTSTRYTSRKGQGGAQSSNDNSKGKANSIGSQLRRAGEIQLRQDVAGTLEEWSSSGLLERCAIFFLSLSKNLMKGFWEDTATVTKEIDCLFKKSPSVIGIPLDVGRPSFEGCCAINDLMMELTLEQIDLEVHDKNEKHIKNEETSSLEPINESNNEDPPNKVELKEEQFINTPLTPLHEAARDGDVDTLISLLSLDNDGDDIDSRAGANSQTPLHYAANASNIPSNASKCVYELLVTAHANPCILDARNRPPYFLARNDIIRNAFRKARAELGENIWKWSESAKVDSPLSEEALARKKEASKKKRQRQKQKRKERVAQELSEKSEAEKNLSEEKAKNQKHEDDRRSRAGLKQKKGELSCDFCENTCKRKSQMFARLDFYYCSTDCVKKHQRELMAAAAAARFKK